MFAFRKFFIVVMLILVLLPGSVVAQDGRGSAPADGRGSAPFPGLGNPIKANSILEFINTALDVILQLAVPVAVIFIIWAGFLFVVARGNPAKLEIAKKAILYALIGVALIFGARYIAAILTTTLKEIGSEQIFLNVERGNNHTFL